MHRVLKAETTMPPAPNLRAREQRRLDRWRREYNHERPHESLGGRVPAALYARSPRRLHTPAAPAYPAHWQTRVVRVKGYIKFEGVMRFVGRAFERQRIGLEPVAPGLWHVHLGPLLIGSLHAADGLAGMRAAQPRPPRNHPRPKPDV